MGDRTKNGAYTGQRSDGVAILSLSIGQVEFEGWFGYVVVYRFVYQRRRDLELTALTLDSLRD